MKKLILLVIVALFSFTFFGCTVSYNDQTILPPIVENSPVIPEIDSSEDNDNENDKKEDEEISTQEKKKRYYLVSNVNSLRVRSKPNTTSTTLGYLDKNDALYIVERSGEYYKTIFREQTAYVYASYCAVMEIEIKNEAVEKVVDEGVKLLGHPYVWGSQRYHWGNGKLNLNFKKGEFDCSALVLYVYYISNGVILDVTSRLQSYNGTPVKKSELERGDLMFFTNESRKNKVGVERIGHVGIYFGNNYILHTASDHAVIEPISTLRWSYFVSARRVV